MSVLLWVLALSVVLLFLRGVTCSLTSRRAFKAAFFPGVLFAAAARSLACGISGAPLKAVNLPWRTGEPVEHEKPKLAVGPALIAILPFVSGIACVLAVRGVLAPGIVCEAQLPPFDTTANSVGIVLDTSRDLVRSEVLERSDLLRDWRSLAFLYLAFSILVFSAPSYSDWRIILGTCGMGLLLVATLEHFGVRPALFSRGWFVQTFYMDGWLEAIGLVFVTAVTCLVSAATIHGAWRFLLAVLRTRKDIATPYGDK